ncbi:hypothetical protein G6F68_020300 [Rhizopus microsporus]|nr:hypothetical protein G6F68_020300 [Rhizopus microsporus]
MLDRASSRRRRTSRDISTPSSLRPLALNAPASTSRNSSSQFPGSSLASNRPSTNAFFNWSHAAIAAPVAGSHADSMVSTVLLSPTTVSAVRERAP